MDYVCKKFVLQWLNVAVIESCCKLSQDNMCWMLRNNSVRLSVEDVLHQFEIQEGFEDEYCSNLDEESTDDDAPRGAFTTSNGQ